MINKYRITVMNMILLIFLIAIYLTASNIYAKDTKIVEYSTSVDKNNNKILDTFETKLAEKTFSHAGAPAKNLADVIIAVDHAPTAADKRAIENLGGEVYDMWSDLVYAIHAGFPASTIQSLTNILGTVLVEDNARSYAHLYYSVRQCGQVRKIWTTGAYNYIDGNPAHRIAIVDTGIDDTHTDFYDKVDGWADYSGMTTGVSGDEYIVPTDKGEHGSHVAGIIAGSGAAAGIATGSGQLPITYAYCFNTTAYYGYYHPFPLNTQDTCTTILSNLKWNVTGDGSTNYLRTRDFGSNIWGTASGLASSSQPLSLSIYTAKGLDTPNSFYDVVYKSTTCATGSAYWLQIKTPMKAIGDNEPLMCGVARGCHLVGVKVLDDSGHGSSSEMLNGLSWVNTNRTTFNIVCANMSLGFTSAQPTIDAAVNNLAEAGVVPIVSAGNARDDAGYTGGIFSPASALKCICVAATNAYDTITYYSSWGTSASRYPDVCAPGGSSGYYFETRRPIIAVDSNDADNTTDYNNGTEKQYADAFANDYTQKEGTSMAAPHVTGLVGLIADAMGSWGFSEDTALKTKMLILMTATETNTLAAESTRPANSNPSPTLDRGTCDNSEGYGRINADAAIEAVLMSYTFSSVSTSFGSLPTDKKCWARKVTLSRLSTYTFNLDNPSSADYDLYLYRYTPDTVGNPIIQTKSVTAGLGADESIIFTPAADTSYYLVIKYVAGTGMWILSTQVAVPVELSRFNATIMDINNQENDLNQYLKLP